MIWYLFDFLQWYHCRRGDLCRYCSYACSSYDWKCIAISVVLVAHHLFWITWVETSVHESLHKITLRARTVVNSIYPQDSSWWGRSIQFQGANRLNRDSCLRFMRGVFHAAPSKTRESDHRHNNSSDIQAQGARQWRASGHWERDRGRVASAVGADEGVATLLQVVGTCQRVESWIVDRWWLTLWDSKRSDIRIDP